MILFLQTNIPGRLLVWVVDQKSNIRGKKFVAVTFHGSDKLLSLVDQLRRAQHITWRSFQKIMVVRGPGPFTAVRTGIIVANTLGVLLNVPVQGIVSSTQIDPVQLLVKVQKAKTALVRPWYGRSPNITRAKKR